MSLDVTAVQDDLWAVTFPQQNHTRLELAKRFFCQLNDFPPPYSSRHPANQTCDQALVSCIIVLNENLPFVREQLIPSILTHSGHQPIELIIVWNGSQDPGESLHPIGTIRSDWGAVARAYNVGAGASTAPILAIFHDDCIVDDPLWIEKCLQRLDSGADAVAGEFRQLDTVADVAFPRLPIAKSVPLVIRRDTFQSVGGYDEYHYAGYEDLDFTLSLLRQGKKLVATDLRIRHFNGMSSTLKYHPIPGLDQLYALTALPRTAIIKRFREFTESGISLNGIDYMQLAKDVQLLYVLNKYRDFLSDLDPHRYADAAAALELHITAQSLEPGGVLEQFRTLDMGFNRQPKDAL